MKDHANRETLMCVGGPWHSKRLSVPTGLVWLQLAPEVLSINAGAEAADIEQIAAVIAFSVDAAWDPDAHPGDAKVYVRQAFVTGEAGMVDVLVFQPSR